MPSGSSITPIPLWRAEHDRRRTASRKLRRRTQPRAGTTKRAPGSTATNGTRDADLPAGGSGLNLWWT